MFEINTQKKTGSAFNLIFFSFNEIFKEKPDNFPLEIIPKITRTAIIAETLYQEGHKPVIKENEAKNECLAALFESFVFYVRIIYDLSTEILQKYSTQNLTKSYSTLVKKIEKGNLKEIDGELRKYLNDKNGIFKDLKDIRDSIKRQSNASIYVKNKEYYIIVKYDDKIGKKYKTLDNRLSSVIFEHSVFLAILAINIRKFIKAHNSKK